MRNCYVCVGSYADNPFVFQRIGLQAYCMEELCYILTKNAYLLDHSIVSRELVLWIEKECGLKELAGELFEQVNRQVSESVFVGTILEYVGFFSEEVIQETKRILSEGASLDVYEKRRVRADHFLKQGKIRQALQEYERLEDEIPYQNGTAGDRETLAKVHHNKGVLLTQMFLFEEASQEFYLAYQIGGSEESYVEYLLALRMNKSEEEYLAFIAEHEEAYRYSLLAEKRIGNVKEKWQDSEAMKGVMALRMVRAADGNLRFVEEAGKVTRQLKDHYRSLMQG